MVKATLTKLPAPDCPVAQLTLKVKYAAPLKDDLKVKLVRTKSGKYKPKDFDLEVPPQNRIRDMLNGLNTSYVPDDLPCREEQIERVAQFVRNSIKPGGESAAMYISGVPGTGKTATVQTVIRKLQSDKSAPDFKYVYVNAMEFVDPRQFFVVLYKALVPGANKIGVLAARRQLNAKFEMIDKKRKPIVILVDELDHMCTKRQDLIYDIFNWTTNEKARITVIAIANTLDLPERLLSQRVSSRLGSNRLCFDPYDFRQIEQIINGRFKDTGAFDDKALQLASRKVAALSGDLRKAIDIMRQAGEIAVRKKSEKILIEHVQAAIAESQATIRMAYIASLSEHELILFKALVAEVQAKGVEEIRFAELYKQYQIQAHDTYAVMGEMMVRERVSKLASMRLLVLAPVTNNPASRNWFLKKIRLAISLQECNFILNSIEEKENR